jgi:hypothetical protein
MNRLDFNASDPKHPISANSHTPKVLPQLPKSPMRRESPVRDQVGLIQFTWGIPFLEIERQISFPK